MLHSRLKRVTELIKESLGTIIDLELCDPEIPPFVTVHSVKVSKDLRVADVFVTLLQDDDKESIKDAVKSLNKSAGFIRHKLGKSIQLKYLPLLKFHYNPSTRYALEIESLLRSSRPPGPKVVSPTSDPEDEQDE